MPIKKSIGVWNKGRRGSGFGQRQVFSEDYAHACSLYGKTFINAHIEAKREGRTKTTLRELIKQKQK
ncbi:MAG: hypothetical protein HON47_01655 [Candidatus Diapherotrites archaeon]|jgi:hypothetical protein|uniref:Uncharacterized protein n=1 Tax=Candidatus Iainarchaeum sp. TaxID=3101447 RepID=A0A8T5GET3_9ARCH|nr:hypothetical protein [Candidatus Diapherotrites archaeon]